MLEKYLDFLWEYNRKVNVISRRMTRESFKILVKETLCLNQLIKGSPILDAGSGNGLLGVPLAIVNPDKRVVLIESKVKKYNFLSRLKSHLGLSNITIRHMDISFYFGTRKHHDPGATLVARGFPKPDMLISCLAKGCVGALFLITSKKKMTKFKKSMERMHQKTYNIPFRDHIVISRMENVSRETKRKQV